jgi:hypothetical protein
VRKIPTVFLRDPENQDRLLRAVHPACGWVLDGEGVALHKADGTCMLLGVDRRWWARRQVKPGKTAPPEYVEVDFDETTGKRFGWEPVEQSGYVKMWSAALHASEVPPEHRMPGTYELVAPTIGQNPEGVEHPTLLFHETLPVRPDAPRDYDGLRDWLATYPGEGVVFHHKDGRMAKIKRRDVMDA